MFSAHLLVLNCLLTAASVKITDRGSGSAQHGSSPQFASDASNQDVLSQHMLRLYEKYNKETHLRDGNTVRSFRAIPDSVDRRTLYLLNLTTLQDSEVILSVTFHFLLDRHPHLKPWFCKRFKSPSCPSSPIHPSLSISLRLRSASSGSEVSHGSVGSFLGNVTFHPHRRGVWQMKDVTQVIKEARNKGHLLVSVELDLGQQYQRRPGEALSSARLPYLLLFADDHALAEPNSMAASLQRYDPFLEGGETSSLPLHRVRREAALLSDPILNNELPEVHSRRDPYSKDSLWERNWYLALKPKSKPGRKEKIRKSQNEGAVEKGGGANDREGVNILTEGKRMTQELHSDDSTVKKPRHKDSQTLVANDGQRQRSEGRDGKQHKGKHTGSNLPSPLLRFDEQTMRKARRRQWGGAQHPGCSRRNLRVDFADIGWSEWVIAPTAFDAFYCSGTCGFPMPKVVRPSNHATIQSIVRAVGIIPGVPEPCCVPEKMSPLAVLYQDEARNPVLKVYPNMSVQSCSCR
ncbi:hypothetical protein LDENG_00204840 [Lucifuga dentata]|nr:hypothetical protein LDENG_00204840 [Lucifuga dentata]